ncbi:MAG: 16S rRNA (uracil(1498)-N(3))-methyltransferase [Desulfurivibrio sp.]|nr:MAG: 16S rRNA (uracil(1498)-N(3))-methyltransferase [Desulfurivibrio sp.]
MHRFFIEPRAIDGPRATLAGPEAHHLRHVLRLTAGEEIELFDGSGTIYRAKIDQLGKAVELAIISRQRFSPGTPALFLAQGLLKGRKMDFLVQKATELGVTGFLPFHSAFCAVPALIKDAKSSRWEKIIMEACKQCGRPIPLQMAAVSDFGTLLAATAHHPCKLIFWEKETATRLAGLAPLPPHPSIIALVGPEGGFADTEIEQAVQAGFTPVSLGRQILRAETAALSVMAILQYLGDNL